MLIGYLLVLFVFFMGRGQLASGGRREEILPTVFQCMGQSPLSLTHTHTRTHARMCARSRPQMLIVPRLISIGFKITMFFWKKMSLRGVTEDVVWTVRKLLQCGKQEVLVTWTEFAKC